MSLQGPFFFKPAHLTSVVSIAVGEAHPFEMEFFCPSGRELKLGLRKAFHSPVWSLDWGQCEITDMRTQHQGSLENPYKQEAACAPKGAAAGTHCTPGPLEKRT